MTFIDYIFAFWPVTLTLSMMLMAGFIYVWYTITTMVTGAIKVASERNKIEMMKSHPLTSVSPEPQKEDVIEWIVNQYGELGVMVNGKCWFFYKGLVIKPAKDVLFRSVTTREFGNEVKAETELSEDDLRNGEYVSVEYEKTRCTGAREYWTWQPVPLNNVL